MRLRGLALAEQHIRLHQRHVRQVCGQDPHIEAERLRLTTVILQRKKFQERSEDKENVW